MRIFKKVGAALCGIVFLLTLPFGSAAAVSADASAGQDPSDSETEMRSSGESFSAGGLTYELLADGTLRCTGLAVDNDRAVSVTVPSSVDDRMVSEIGSNAFEDEDTIETMTVGDSVRVIGRAAFEHCNNLRKLTLPSRMDAIETRAFYMCGLLEDFAFPSGLTEIADECFFGCDRLNDVYIPEGVTAIGASAFYSNMYLRTVHLPSTLTELGDWSFGACENLETINMPPAVQSIGSGAFNYCWRISQMTLPEGLREVADQTFEGCAGLKTLDIPASVERIGASAFESCIELRHINLLGGVKQVAQRAFAFCLALTDLVFPEGLQTIGAESFEDVHLTVDLPLSLVSIGREAFNTEDSVINYAGSPRLWSRVVIDPGNIGATDVRFALSDPQDSTYVMTLKTGSQLNLSTLPQSNTPVIQGLEAGREAPRVLPVLEAVNLPEGGSLLAVSVDGEILEPEDPCGTATSLQVLDSDGVLLDRAFVIVKGDLLGTGRLSIAQLVCMANALIDEESINELQLMAGDYNNSNRIDISDLVIEAQMLRMDRSTAAQMTAW